MKIQITLTCRLAPKLGQIKLIPQPENAYDDEAIAVFVPTPVDGWTQDGYVAAYYKIRKRGHWSAGRLVDHIPSSGQIATVIGPNVAEVELLEVKA